MFGYLFLIFAFVSVFLFLLFDTYFKVALYSHVAICLICLVMFLVGGGVARVSSSLRGGGKGKIERLLYCFLLVLLFFVSFYIAKTKLPFQFDLTENKAYTLSSQTTEILSKANKAIKAQYFLRGLSKTKHDLDLLSRYKAKSSNFLVSQHDLDKERPLAESLGIKELNSLYLSYGEESNAKVKTGVIVSGGLSEEKITNALLKLTRVSKPTIYFASGHGEGSIEDKDEAGFSFVKEAFEADGFIVENADLTKASTYSPKHSAIGFLSIQKDLSPLELEQLKLYLSKGGALFVLIEPKRQSNLLDLLSSYGFIIGNDTIVGLEKFTTGSAALGVQPVISKYANHKSLNNFDKNIVVSAAASIRKKATADQITELAFTDDDTWAETSLNELYSKTPTAKKEANDISGPVSIAAAYDSSLNRMVVVGDLDFSANVNLYQLFNRDFLLNLANWVVGDEEYVSIRSGTIRKSKKVIGEEEYSNIFLWTGVILPELILLFGICYYTRKHEN